MASKSVFSSTSGCAPESILPSEMTEGRLVRQGCREIPSNRVLQNKGLMEKEFRTKQHYFAMTNELDPGTSLYQSFAADRVPRYVPHQSFGSDNTLEESQSFRGEVYSSHYTHEPLGLSRGLGYFSSPLSPGMPSQKYRPKVEEHEPDHRLGPKSTIQNLLAGDGVNVLLPAPLNEKGVTVYNGDVSQSTLENLSEEYVLRQDAVSAAHENTVHKCRSPNQSEHEDANTELVKPMSKLLVSTWHTSSQLIASSNIETPGGRPISETELDSEGEWLTGRYIPGFLREQWLNGSALEIPTTEACALAIVREALVDQIMTTLPPFDPRWTPNFTSNAGSKSNQSSSSQASTSNKPSVINSSSPNHGRKRSLDDGDESPADGDDGSQDPQRPSLPEPQSRTPSLQLPCPFRKNDTEKYNLRDYRVCATKAWDSIGRLKQHLITAHKAPIYCPKCKKLFETREGLYIHLDVPDSRSCKHQDAREPAGVTLVMEERLRGRWKSSSPQDFWTKIYMILFPDEPVPSPDFIPIQDVPSARDSPGPKVERPTRHEFKRLVRARVEASVDQDIKSLHEHTKSKLADMVEDCYVQINQKWNRNDEIGHDESPMSDTHGRQIDGSSLQMYNRQQPNWEAMESSSSPMWGGNDWNTNASQMETSISPPQLSTAAHDLQRPSADSSLSTCSCLRLCKCSVPMSSESAVPKQDPRISDPCTQLYEALWNAGPSDVDAFDSFVYED